MTNVEVHFNEKNKKFLVSGITGNVLKVPSDMFPLKGHNHIRLFHHGNTSECSDERVLSALSNFKVQLGRCYDNAECLAELLRQNGVEQSRIKTYVCWTIFGNVPGYPVHHCFTVVDDEHVFDCIPNVPAGVTQEEYIDIMAKHAGIYSTELYGTGKVQQYICHIAKECTPEYAVDQRCDLELKYPNHPAFRTITNGYTSTQRAILDRTK